MGGLRPTYESQIEMATIRREKEAKDTELRITIKGKRLQWRWRDGLGLIGMNTVDSRTH